MPAAQAKISGGAGVRPLFAQAGHADFGTGDTRGTRVDAGCTSRRVCKDTRRLHGVDDDQGVRMKNAKLDSISLEIQWKRLISMIDEAAAAFVRTSFSLMAREANDFAVVLTDAQGRSIGQSSMSIPSFIATLPATVKHFLKKFPAATLRPGDVMITNDPWMGTGHIYDVNVAMPIFHQGRIIA